MVRNIDWYLYNYCKQNVNRVHFENFILFYDGEPCKEEDIKRDVHNFTLHAMDDLWNFSFSFFLPMRPQSSPPLPQYVKISLSPIFHELCRNFGLKTKQFSAEMGPPEFHNKVGEKFLLFD